MKSLLRILLIFFLLNACKMDRIKNSYYFKDTTMQFNTVYSIKNYEIKFGYTIQYRRKNSVIFKNYYMKTNSKDFRFEISDIKDTTLLNNFLRINVQQFPTFQKVISEDSSWIYSFDGFKKSIIRTFYGL